MENQKPATLSEISYEIRKAISDNNAVLIPLMGNMMDEKIKANNDILIPLIDKKIRDNNEILIPLIDKKIRDNNEILIPLIDKKIKDNNEILIPLIDKKIKDNNEILIPLIDKKIKDNNEYIFSEFNDQTERILNLFRGVVMVRRDDSFSVNF